MVDALRAGRGERGLLYGQGEYVTKHHALVLTRHDEPAAPTDAQSAADAERGVVPAIVRDPDGEWTAEATTVVFDRAGEPEFGVVVARSPAGRDAGPNGGARRHRAAAVAAHNARRSSRQGRG